ncbi:hypothetical protein [Aureibacillus halotolerans]|uniref:Uncharacterized protein n=1 Tax=Aureibacillus halotolerans TaxID=1508390 RepID=A0A4V3D5L2_9BACI|nr:hypothetical protein [Aureibacillus halotolerans]TDQ40417.1 hypothetical protein EV213_106135 [Aureibacillus halotolerans]
MMKQLKEEPTEDARKPVTKEDVDNLLVRIDKELSKSKHTRELTGKIGNC